MPGADGHTDATATDRRTILQVAACRAQQAVADDSSESFDLGGCLYEAFEQKVEMQARFSSMAAATYAAFAAIVSSFLFVQVRRPTRLGA